MSRGPPSRRALAEAIPLAERRGTFQLAGRGPEKLFDFAIVSTMPIVFVKVCSCSRIHAPVTELMMKFQDRLIRMRMIPDHASISREIWLRSRHGRWRFFRLAGESLAEQGQDGQPLVKMMAAGT
jgi:hypothetical protein